jgi:hypothetical protein
LRSKSKNLGSLSLPGWLNKLSTIGQTEQRGNEENSERKEKFGLSKREVIELLISKVRETVNYPGKKCFFEKAISGQF